MGVVTADHPQCDVGAKILRYLRTGDNGGDPELDQQFAGYVGAPLPQARALADQYIEQCDQQVAQQQAAQASASAEAAASASAAATEAQQQLAIAAQQQRSCMKIGGRVDAHWGWCASTVQGNPSGQAGADCKDASVDFNPDGTIADYSYNTTKDFDPGCFR